MSDQQPLWLERLNPEHDCLTCGQPKDECVCNPEAEPILERCPLDDTKLENQLTECGQYIEAERCPKCNRSWWNEIPVAVRS